MEHALVFVSIVIGIAVTDQIISLHRLLRARERVRWDWMPLAVATLVLLTVVQIWWAVASPDEATLTIGAFLPTLIQLILLVLLSLASLPDDVPPAGIDLRAYYAANRRYIWTLYAATFGWTLVAGGAERIARGQSFGSLVLSQAPDWLFFALMASLVFVGRRWWHALVIALLMLGPLHWLSRSLG